MYLSEKTEDWVDGSEGADKALGDTDDLNQASTRAAEAGATAVPVAVESVYAADRAVAALVGEAVLASKTTDPAPIDETAEKKVPPLDRLAWEDWEDKEALYPVDHFLSAEFLLEGSEKLTIQRTDSHFASPGSTIDQMKSHYAVVAEARPGKPVVLVVSLPKELVESGISREQANELRMKVDAALQTAFEARKTGSYGVQVLGNKSFKLV